MKTSKTADKKYAVIADNELCLTDHLFPTNPQHILNMGGEICIPADRNSLSILNLSDLLTEKHDLTVEDLSTGSNWQTGLPWMELGTEDMPLSPYQSLIIPKEVEELIKEEYIKGIFLVPEPLTLETKILGLGTGANFSIFLDTMPLIN